MIADKYRDIELHLYGAPGLRDFKIISDLILELGMHRKIFLKGKAANDDVPSILADSYVLLSSQPATKRAKGGFPTKLGEYMAVGKPTLMTDVGEINKYIIDGKNGWLARPSDPIHFAEKLEYIINNYDEAMQVARNGRKFILENFDYKVQTARLINFLDGLKPVGLK